MAINLNHSVYGAQFKAFRDLAGQESLTQDTLVSVDEAGRGKGLLNESGESRKIVVKKGDTIRPLFGRSQGHVDLNNEVRDLFKETVLKVCGANSLDDLPKSVHDVMKTMDYDNEGHPLSLRRIRAVTSAILAEADIEAKAGAPQVTNPVDTIVDMPKDDVSGIGDKGNRIHEIEGEDEVASSVDDEEVSFKYAVPGYIAGLPSETEEMFMEFYCDAIDQSIEDGQTKAECDEMLNEMFKTVGYGKNDRKLLVELLANGKPRFLEEDGALPFRSEGIRFAEKFKAILDLTKEYRTKLKPDGNIVADTILATLKTVERMFDVDDLPHIDADMCAEISEAAKKVDTAELLAPPSGKGLSAKSLSRRLESFRREAAEKFAAELLRPNDSELKVALKQNLLMNMALAHAGSQKDSLVEEVEEHYDVLVEKHGCQDLLTEIAPGLGINANADLLLPIP